MRARLYLSETADTAAGFHLRFGDRDADPRRAFDGPLEALLRRVRRGGADPLELEVSAITRQFLDLLEAIGEADLPAESEFVKLATALLRLKARRMLPRLAPSEAAALDESLAELEARLAEIALYRGAVGALRKRLEERREVWVRPLPTPPTSADESAGRAVARPFASVDLVDVVEAFRRVVERARSRPPAPVPERRVSLSRLIRRMDCALAPGRRCLLEDLVAELLDGATRRADLTAAFLAVLELARQGRIAVFQAQLFAPIEVEGKPAVPVGPGG